MYCRNCGHKLEEGDKFCSSCGAKTIVESDADASAAETYPGAVAAAAEPPQGQGESILDNSKPFFEPFDFSKIDLALGIEAEPEPKESEKPVSPVEEFDWNIHTFPGREVEKTEDIEFDWSMPVEEPAPVKAPEPPAPVAQPAAEKQPERQQTQVQEKTPLPGTLSPEERAEGFVRADVRPAAAEKKAEPAQQEPLAGLEERLFGELDSKTDEAKKQSEEMDRFFTFHKKNEEFQKLLDQEYEKIKSGNMLSDEMTTAAAASEEKFATRTPEDPMEELFASEGVVKGYEPKPIETDVLERIEAAEAEKKAREESARLVEEEKARARKEAEEKARQEAEERARKEAEALAAAEAAKAAKEAEEAARLRLEQDAKRAADARAAQEAAERERARLAAREEAVAAMKGMEEEAKRVQAEAESRLQEQAAKIQAEVARQEAEAAMLQAEAARKEAEEKARLEAEAAKAMALAEKQKAEQEQQQAAEEVPVKTKAVNKAEILAGMATATEMVERDRAFAAAEAAAKAKAKEEQEAIELPDFLGHLDETEKEEPKPSEEPKPAIDIFEELATIEQETEPSQGAGQDGAADDVLSLEDLLAEDEKEPETPEIKQPEPEEEPAEEILTQPEEQQPEESEEAQPKESEAEQTEETAAADEKVSLPADTDDTSAAEQAPAKKQDAHKDEDDEDDEDEEEETGGKGRIVLKICLIILIMLLALEVAGVVIKVAAPNSEAAKFIDSQLNKVIQMVTGDDAEYRVLAAPVDIRTKPIQDKTELIQEEMGKNKDGNIEQIEYNAELKYDPKKEYENTDINLTQELSDVAWYKDAADNQVYFDQAIVGAVIAYDSHRMNLLNYGDKSVLNLVQKDTDLYKELKDTGKKDSKQTMRTLQIGEIRQAGTSYYVWVSEKVGRADSKEASETKKIYQMTPEGEMMKLTAAYEL